MVDFEFLLHSPSVISIISKITQFYTNKHTNFKISLKEMFNCLNLFVTVIMQIRKHKVDFFLFLLMHQFAWWLIELVCDRLINVQSSPIPSKIMCYIGPS